MYGVELFHSSGLRKKKKLKQSHTKKGAWEELEFIPVSWVIGRETPWTDVHHNCFRVI